MGIALLVILVGCIIYTVFDVFKYIKPMTKEEYEDTIGCAIWILLMVFSVVGSFIVAIIDNV
jgi:hypothetical protein